MKREEASLEKSANSLDNKLKKGPYSWSLDEDIALLKIFLERVNWREVAAYKLKKQSRSVINRYKYLKGRAGCDNRRHTREYMKEILNEFLIALENAKA